VQIYDAGGGTIDVRWNGGSVHAFTGVTMILVQPENAKNDRITFYTPLLP
jgi:hypothetical protein